MCIFINFNNYSFFVALNREFSRSDEQLHKKGLERSRSNGEEKINSEVYFNYLLPNASSLSLSLSPSLSPPCPLCALVRPRSGSFWKRKSRPPDDSSHPTDYIDTLFQNFKKSSVIKPDPLSEYLVCF